MLFILILKPIDKTKSNDYQNAKHQHLSDGSHNVTHQHLELMETSLGETEPHQYSTVAVCSESILTTFNYLSY